jgi:hypothetical protein
LVSLSLQISSERSAGSRAMLLVSIGLLCFIFGSHYVELL